jgi:hypothetical protein
VFFLISGLGSASSPQGRPSFIKQRNLRFAAPN